MNQKASATTRLEETLSDCERLKDDDHVSSVNWQRGDEQPKSKLRSAWPRSRNSKQNQCEQKFDHKLNKKLNEKYSKRCGLLSAGGDQSAGKATGKASGKTTRKSTGHSIRLSDLEKMFNAEPPELGQELNNENNPSQAQSNAQSFSQRLNARLRKSNQATSNQRIPSFISQSSYKQSSSICNSLTASSSASNSFETSSKSSSFSKSPSILKALFTSSSLNSLTSSLRSTNSTPSSSFDHQLNQSNSSNNSLTTGTTHRQAAGSKSPPTSPPTSPPIGGLSFIGQTLNMATVTGGATLMPNYFSAGQPLGRPHAKLQHSLSQKPPMKKPKNKRRMDSLASCFRVQRSNSISGLDLEFDEGLNEYALEKLSFQQTFDRSFKSGFEKKIGRKSTERSRGDQEGPKELKKGQKEENALCQMSSGSVPVNEESRRPSEEASGSKGSSCDATGVNKLAEERDSLADDPRQGDRASSLSDTPADKAAVSGSQVQCLLIDQTAAVDDGREGVRGDGREDTREGAKEDATKDVKGDANEDAKGRAEGVLSEAEGRADETTKSNEAGGASGQSEMHTKPAVQTSEAPLNVETKQLAGCSAVNETEGDKPCTAVESRKEERKEPRKEQRKEQRKERKESHKEHQRKENRNDQKKASRRKRGKAGEQARTVSGEQTACSEHSVARINPGDPDKSDSEFDWNASAAQPQSLQATEPNRINPKTAGARDLKSLNKSKSANDIQNDLQGDRKCSKLKKAKNSCNSFGSALSSPFNSTLVCSKAFASSLSSSLRLHRTKSSLQDTKSSSASQLEGGQKVSKSPNSLTVPKSPAVPKSPTFSKCPSPKANETVQDDRPVEPTVSSTTSNTASSTEPVQPTKLTTSQQTASEPQTKPAPKAATFQRLAAVPNRLKRFARGFNRNRIRESLSDQSKNCIEQLLLHEQCKLSSARSPGAKHELKMKFRRTDPTRDHLEYDLYKTQKSVDYKDLTLMQILALKPIRSKLKSIAENKSFSEQKRASERSEKSERSENSEKQNASDKSPSSEKRITENQPIVPSNPKNQTAEMVLPELQSSPVCGENAPPAADFDAIYAKKSSDCSNRLFSSKFIANNESYNCKGAFLNDFKQDVLKSIGELNKLNQLEQRGNPYTVPYEPEKSKRVDRPDSQFERTAPYDPRNAYARTTAQQPFECANRQCNQQRCECTDLLRQTDENSKQNGAPNGSPKSGEQPTDLRQKKWIQLAGHEQSFYSSNKPGTILKKNDANESTTYKRLNDTADQIVEFIPKFYSIHKTEDGQFIELQDLLTLFDNPCCMMDIKMGSRTFLEQDVSNSRSRPDLYEKLIKIDSNAATQEEHKQKAITKLRLVESLN